MWVVMRNKSEVWKWEISLSELTYREVGVRQVCVWEKHLSFPLVSPHPFNSTHLFLSFPLSVSVSPSLSLPVSCALFQGWGLRHTFHLAYEALILFRACSEGEKGGERDVGGGMRAASLMFILPLHLSFCLDGKLRKKMIRLSFFFFFSNLFV